MSTQKNSEPFRKLTVEERQLIDRLLNTPFAGRDVISRQIDNCLVRTIDENGSLEFQVQTPERVISEYRVPVEARCEDDDGVSINLLLHVIDGRVAELEVYKDDSSRVHNVTQAKNWSFFAPPFLWPSHQR